LATTRAALGTCHVTLSTGTGFGKAGSGHWIEPDKSDHTGRRYLVSSPHG
jgi:hypothetical protein